MTTAEKVQMLRRKRGLSQEALAEELGVSRQTVTRWETGESMPSPRNLRRLSEMSGASVAELTAEDAPAPPPDPAPAREPEPKRRAKPWIYVLAALALAAAVAVGGLGFWLGLCSEISGEDAIPEDQPEDQIESEEVIGPPAINLPLLPLE